MGKYVQRPPTITAYQINADGTLPAELEPFEITGQISASGTGFVLNTAGGAVGLSPGDFVYWSQPGALAKMGAAAFNAAWVAST